LDPSPLISEVMGPEGGEVVDGDICLPRLSLFDGGVCSEVTGLRCAVLVDEFEQPRVNTVSIVHLECQHESSSEVGVAD
ncbi:hypothetical protein PMAYCL1PPCAC_07930, partial [Pristionchus mayeri]